ncbi:hypothetical protein ACRDNQ_16250 [Palleronia sp. KMU-117]|uniref:hypothetical protein n=1 Tax=Palleronia sp. KMU-117 TaxID=3434108 RepID=UPI003D7236A8
MSDTLCKIRLKIGSMELEYEGSPDFLEGGIERLLETMGELSQKVPPQSSAPLDQAANPASSVSHTGSTTANQSAASISFTTSTLAAYTDAKSGPELALCAMFYLERVRGNTSNSSGEILQEMKTAGGYYKSTMSGNNASNLKNLAKAKRINEVSNGKYTLASSEAKRLEAVVAQIS